MLLIGLMALALQNVPSSIERDIHSRVILALAAENLSQVDVGVDGRNIFLSGPQELLAKAEELVSSMPETSLIKTLATTDSILGEPSESKTFTQIFHPEGIYWPPKSVEVINETTELLITKTDQNIEVNGSVPSNEVQRVIMSKIAQVADIPAHLIDVTVNRLDKIPDWYSEGLALIIPFMQWVEQGKIEYQDNRIMLDGMVPDSKSIKALESAIADLPSSFQIENKLRLGKREY